jgi:hypothetical protein
MTVTPIRPHSRAAADAVDLEALTEAELRVIFYAANFHLLGADHLSPDQGLTRMIRTVTTVVGDLGLDLIREVGELAAHAVLAGNDQMQAQLFPDTNRWNWTETTARVFLRATAQHPHMLAVHTVAQRWHAALTGATSTSRAVAA